MCLGVNFGLTWFFIFGLFSAFGLFSVFDFFGSFCFFWIRLCLHLWYFSFPLVEEILAFLLAHLVMQVEVYQLTYCLRFVY